ncbi:pilus assembly protein Flp/PilA [Loktanella sp. DSM 29012]|uniref:Flp family type IVb pilin n=1 Tax=Loktanella gaetbuli TaxID=2881335 RepID=A0ABS8BY36_9RHOB|nr:MULTISPECIES: Flp family type IVb pilin [Loktanella]MCB5200638.1 Flp family type IVb pilin [Loktanella gaetbuli]SEQ77711.1 pilus assembly protein Flp/PilA [Loktanella sp. DSM 29012]
MTLARNLLSKTIRTFVRDEDGATAIEYGLFAALIGAVIVGTVATLGQDTQAGFSAISTELKAAQATADTSGG